MEEKAILVETIKKWIKLDNEIKQLQNDVSEIKSVLTNIVEKLDGISNSKFK